MTTKNPDHELVTVPGFPRPKGYANGIVASGRILTIAGQIGWDENEKLVSREFLPQLDRALQNVIAVVAAAGGTRESIVQMTIFATDLSPYRTAGKALGEVWRARMGNHYPTMALIGCAALLEEGAMVEVLATAVLPEKL